MIVPMSSVSVLPGVGHDASLSMEEWRRNEGKVSAGVFGLVLTMVVAGWIHNALHVPEERKRMERPRGSPFGIPSIPAYSPRLPDVPPEKWVAGASSTDAASMRFQLAHVLSDPQCV